MKELILFDIDGTLVDPATHKIPESTITALNKLRENGYPIAIATGRSMRNGKLLSDLIYKSWDGFVCNNGLSVYDRDTTPVFKAFMSKDIIEECVAVARQEGLNLTFQGNDHYYMLKEPDKYCHEAWEFLNMTIPTPVEPVHAEDIFVVVAFGPKGWDYAPYKKIDGITVLHSASSYADLVPSDHSKRTGIYRLMKHLGAERYIAFGDSMNDYDMLKGADISVAMGQGDEKLKKIATFVTKPVHEDGIYYACRQLNLI